MAPCWSHVCASSGSSCVAVCCVLCCSLLRLLLQFVLADVYTNRERILDSQVATELPEDYPLAHTLFCGARQSSILSHKKLKLRHLLLTPCVTPPYANHHLAHCCHTTSITRVPDNAAAHCSTLQHSTTHCNTLKHTASHCTTLHHTAPHCITRCGGDLKD